MKRFAILFILVILMAGGGFAAWWFYLRPPDDQGMAEATPPLEPIPIEFRPLVIPIIQDGQVIRQLVVQITLQVGAEHERRVLEYGPYLTDAFLGELYGLYALRHVRELGNPQPLLNRRLLAVSDRVLGPNIVDQVRVTEVKAGAPTKG